MRTRTAITSLPTPAKVKRRAPEILAADAKVFACRGYHGASTQDIAVLTCSKCGKELCIGFWYG
jgi:AcrR family transcriptional regulator